MPSRVHVLAAAAAVIAAGAVAAAPAGAAPGGGGCLLQGTAKFKNGPGTTSAPFSYTFSGKLSNCQDSTGSGPTGGKIATIIPATGTGSCQNGTSAGYAYIAWTGGGGTVVKYSENSVAAEVVLQGSVLPKYKVGTKVYKTTMYAGDSVLSDLAFEADPQQCAGSGVTSAGIAGFAGLGSSG